MTVTLFFFQNHLKHNLFFVFVLLTVTSKLCSLFHGSMLWKNLFWSKLWVCDYTLKVKSFPGFSFIFISWLSPDHRSSPLNDTETTSPGKETPCFPKGCQSKVHYSSCVFLCTCFSEKRRKEGDCVNRRTLAVPLKCTTQHQRLIFILILSAVLMKTIPPLLLSHCRFSLL